ncbi:RTA1 like protein-domain-containing protein [Calycina marina]|uniref:RTA1 like protein-domain-containing protein n=1 Tax=Calycina marina TaxID=1763456 RepID=A0A9P8CCW8_9HELO|nr:RTA1 like protein-domain-containing protein [Calycina marina]
MATPTTTFPFQSMTSTVSQTASATASCITATPGKHGYVPPEACNAQWNYDPSFGAAIAFAILFGITATINVVQAFYYKKMKLCWPLLMGALWEFASFVLRAPGTLNQQNSVFPYSSSVLVLLAPMWINAFLYMVMGRMIYFFVPEQNILGVKAIKIAKIFVWLDVASFITQVAGGTMISPGSSNMMLGIHIYMGGIGFQEICIIGFMSIAIKFHLKMLEEGRNRKLDDRPRNWQPLMYVMYVCLVLITIRIIFRLVEFAAGMDPTKNPIPFHEAYFLVLDCVPMLICCLLVNCVHPGRILVGENSEFPKSISRKEKASQKLLAKEERRTARYGSPSPPPLPRRPSNTAYAPYGGYEMV